MNVLEKILEEMKGRVALHDVGVAYEKRKGSITDMVRHQGALEELDVVMLFIRSHMDEVLDENAGWIPVEERLPNEEEFKEAYCRNKYAAEFVVMIEDATRPTTLYYKNGSWFDEERNYYSVVAWQPLPEPYKEEK